MRQIASSITYLPCLDESCKNHLLTPDQWILLCFDDFSVTIIEFCLFLALGVFDVLAYTDKDVAVPFTWIESDPKLIANPQMVKLHSFDTKVSLEIKLFFIMISFWWIMTEYMVNYKLTWLLDYADTQGWHSGFVQEWWMGWTVEVALSFVNCLWISAPVSVTVNLLFTCSKIGC